jgi:hypothetical protein
MSEKIKKIITKIKNLLQSFVLNFLCGSKWNIFKKFFVLLLIFIVVVVVSVVPNYIRPREVEAFALTSTMIIAIALLLASCGLYAVNYQSVNAVVADVWDKASDYIKGLFDSGLDETTREFTVHPDVFDYIRGYISDNFIIGNQKHVIYTNKVLLEFSDSSYVFTPYLGSVGGTGTSITQAVYDSAVKYSQITFGGNVLKYNFYTSGSDYDMYRMYINDLLYSTYAHHYVGSREIFNNVFYTSQQWGENVHLLYATLSVVTMYTVKGSLPPAFAFLYNATTGILYPVVTFREYGTGSYKVYSFRLTASGQLCVGDLAVPLNTEVDYVIDGTIVLDNEFSIDNPLSVPYEIGQVIGRTSDQVIAKEWSDVDTIDRYIAKYGAIPVTLEGEFDLPQTGELDWNALSIPMVGLTDKFPFSIPFDLYNAINNLKTTPEAPTFEVPMSSDFGSAGNVVLDFSAFEGVAVVIRWTVLLGFIIGLILITRKLIRG